MAYKDKDKQREYQRERIAKIRRDYLTDKFCVKCGSVNRLEIDHIDRSAKTSHRIWSWSKERREAELAKCQVLCYDCHLIKTKQERSGRSHGESAYAKGCRCDICKQARKDRYMVSVAQRKSAGL